MNTPWILVSTVALVGRRASTTDPSRRNLFPEGVLLGSLDPS